jgi:hypothetical protein
MKWAKSYRQELVNCWDTPIYSSHGAGLDGRYAVWSDGIGSFCGSGGFPCCPAGD